jgi:ribosomal RNA-processing protein 36
MTTTKPKLKSKSAPKEISSKKPVSRKRFLSGIQTQSHQARDPRFENLDKSTSKESFRQAYSFLEDYQRDEITMLKAQLKQTRDADERERVLKAIQSLTSRKETREAKDRAKDVLNAKKKEIKKEGKKPFYLKKSIEYYWILLMCR